MFQGAQRLTLRLHQGADRRLVLTERHCGSSSIYGVDRQSHENQVSLEPSLDVRHHAHLESRGLEPACEQVRSRLATPHGHRLLRDLVVMNNPVAISVPRQPGEGEPDLRGGEPAQQLEGDRPDIGEVDDLPALASLSPGSEPGTHTTDLVTPEGDEEHVGVRPGMHGIGDPHRDLAAHALTANHLDAFGGKLCVGFPTRNHPHGNSQLTQPGPDDLADDSSAQDREACGWWIHCRCISHPVSPVGMNHPCSQPYSVSLNESGQRSAGTRSPKNFAAHEAMGTSARRNTVRLQDQRRSWHPSPGATSASLRESRENCDREQKP